MYPASNSQHCSHFQCVTVYSEKHIFNILLCNVIGIGRYPDAITDLRSIFTCIVNSICGHQIGWISHEILNLPGRPSVAPTLTGSSWGVADSLSCSAAGSEGREGGRGRAVAPLGSERRPGRRGWPVAVAAVVARGPGRASAGVFPRRFSPRLWKRVAWDWGRRRRGCDAGRDPRRRRGCREEGLWGSVPRSDWPSRRGGSPRTTD